MILASLTFYLFATILIGSAVMVVTRPNPVHSVLFLILAFFNAAGLFVLMGAEFLAMILVVVYVGAVAVLFLFVVMMLDVNFAELRRGFQRYAPIGGVIGIIFLVELIFLLGSWVVTPDAGAAAAAPVPAGISNTAALGAVLYTRYLYAFQAAGVILLVAMIGAIVLTHRSREGVRRQSIAAQIGRRREDAVEVIKVRTGEGV